MTYLSRHLLRFLFVSILFSVCVFVPLAQVSALEGRDAVVEGDGNGGTRTVATTPPGTPNTRTYQPLVNIPGVDNAVTNFGAYINQLYFLAISLAALLAVIKIIIAGVKYMLTDLGSSKQDAKNDIQGALLGLLLIISAFLILTTINPNLANLDVLSRALPIPVGQSVAPTPPRVIAGSAAATAPITSITSPDGTRSSQVTLTDAAINQLPRRNATINGVVTSLPVIHSSNIIQYNNQRTLLGNLPGCRNPDGTARQINPGEQIQYLIANGDITRPDRLTVNVNNPQTIVRSYNCNQ